MRANKQGAIRKILITWKEKKFHYQAALAVRQAAQRGLDILRP